MQEGDLNEDGEAVIVVINDEAGALGSYNIELTGEISSVLAEKQKTFPVWIIILLAAGAAVVGAMIIIRKKKA